MPFKSKAQQRFMFANKPKGVDLKEWASHTDFKGLPEKVAFFATEKMASLGTIPIPTARDFNHLVYARPTEQVYRGRSFHAILNHPDPEVRQLGKQLFDQYSQRSSQVGKYLTRNELEIGGFKPKLAAFLRESDVRALGQEVIRNMDEEQLRKMAQECPSPQRYTFLLELQRRRRGE